MIVTETVTPENDSSGLIAAVRYTNMLTEKREITKFAVRTVITGNTV